MRRLYDTPKPAFLPLNTRFFALVLNGALVLLLEEVTADLGVLQKLEVLLYLRIFVSACSLYLGS